jgi:hypothetical protein
LSKFEELQARLFLESLQENYGPGNEKERKLQNESENEEEEAVVRRSRRRRRRRRRRRKHTW